MPAKRRPKAKTRTRERTLPRLSLTPTQLAWVDSFVRSVSVSGGPSFTREQVVQALVDSAIARTHLDKAVIRTVEDLRIAFGAQDLSAVERMLRERPRIESGLLKALQDSIK